MGRGYLVVEGHGEVKAALNLMHRLWDDSGLPFVHWAAPIRGKSIHTRAGLEKACALVRSKGDAEGLLLLRDADDECPRDTAPGVASLLAEQNLAFPAAAVLLHREYETLFLPCVHLMAGQPLRDERGVERSGLEPDAVFDGDVEAVRGAKEWLSGHMPLGRSYKPTIDQLPLTRMIDFTTLRQADVPCFGTLERALTFLASAAPGEVYPPPAQE